MSRTFGIDSGYLPPPVANYKGDFNCFYQRSGYSEQTWENDNNFQRYKGAFVQDSLHGKGTYTYLADLNKTTGENYLVEGSFYASNIDGYSKITHSNGNYFEGLHKRNTRYGPGVMTYVDGTQDVGLWYGPQLRRLSCTVSPEWIPKLARSPAGKMKLLKFKKLIPIKQKYEHPAHNILRALGAPAAVMNLADDLYNPYIRNPNSLLFNRNLHDTTMFGEIDCTIEVPLNPEEVLETISSQAQMSNIITNKDFMYGIIEYLVENVDLWDNLPLEKKASFMYSKIIEERGRITLEIHTALMRDLIDVFLNEVGALLELPKGERYLILTKRDAIKRLPEKWGLPDVPVKKIPVTDLLAWNNEQFSITMMKHIFINRNLEPNVTFKVAKLIIGDRSEFNLPGQYEKACINFLQNCSLGNFSKAASTMIDQNINPDICDAKGNIAMMFAAARDRWRVIKMLWSFGASVNLQNDEGLTPLTMCILRYFAENDDIVDWEHAFLTEVTMTPEELDAVKEWRPHSSLANICSLSTPSVTETIIIQEDLTIKNSLLERESLLSDLNIDLAADYNLRVILGDFYDDVKCMQVDVNYKNFQKEYQGIEDLNQKYVFDSTCKIPPPPPKAKAGKKGSKSKKGSKKSKSSKGSKKSSKKSSKSSSKKSDKSSKKGKKGKKGKKEKKGKTAQSSSKGSVINEEELLKIAKESRLKIILTTIKMLLQLGADPNYSRVPLPPLIMAICSKRPELLHILLIFGANPNLPSIGENLTPLIVLACLPFSNMNTEAFETLLDSRADPNQRVNANHWVEEKAKLLGNNMPEDDLGKTPLHILCMRYDFEDDPEDNQAKMVKLLLDHGGSGKDKYVEHTPLSLAILRGNIKLIKQLIDSKKVNPYECLGLNMGNPMTVLILKRYNNILPVEKAKEVYDTLLEYNVNPLVDIPIYGNALDFMEVEYPPSEERPSSGKKDKKGKKGKKEKKKKGKDKKSKKSKKGKQANPVEELKDYLVDCGHKMVERHVIGQAFDYLRKFIALGLDPSSDIMDDLLQFFTMKSVGSVLQLLIKRGILEHNTLNLYTTYQILELIEQTSKTSKPTVDDIFENLDWTVEKLNRLPNLVEPEIDRYDGKYKVCFNCGKKMRRVLIPCPECGLVYFCSQECNAQSIKKNTAHNCKLLFYDKERQRMDDAFLSGVQYDPRNNLQKALDSMNKMLFEALSSKYGPNAARQMLADATKNSKLNLDELLKENPMLERELEHQIKASLKEGSGLPPTLAEAISKQEYEKKREAMGRKKGFGSEDSDIKRGKKKGSKSSDYDDGEDGGKRRKKKRGDSTDDEDWSGKGKKGGSSTRSGKKSKRGASSDDEDDGGKPRGKKGKKGKRGDGDDDDDDDGDGRRGKSKGKRGKSEDDDSPRKGKSGKRRKGDDDDDDDDDGEGRRGKSKGKRGKSEDDDSPRKGKSGKRRRGDDDDDDDDEREGRRGKSKGKRKGGDDGGGGKSRKGSKGRKGRGDDDDDDEDERRGKSKASKGGKQTTFGGAGGAKKPFGQDKASGKSIPRGRTDQGGGGGDGLRDGPRGRDAIPGRQEPAEKQRQGGSPAGDGKTGMGDTFGAMPTRAGDGLCGDGAEIGQNKDSLETLPTRYQFLLEQLARLFPNFDFSLLLWPYVCYSGGQLYYRFLDKRPLFCETYSSV